MTYQPKHFEETIKEAEWVQAMNEEIEAIGKNQTWDLANLIEGKTRIVVKLVYKSKFNEKGQLERHKARMVSKVFVQQHGENYGETFTLVAGLDIVIIVLTVATQKNGMFTKWM